MVQYAHGTHPAAHIDYSQILLLVAGWCIVGSATEVVAMLTKDVMTSPTYSELLSHEGPLQFTRQPFSPARHKQALDVYWQKQEERYRPIREAAEERRQKEEKENAKQGAKPGAL